jgi:hypothetical protein
VPNHSIETFVGTASVSVKEVVNDPSLQICNDTKLSSLRPFRKDQSGPAMGPFPFQIGLGFEHDVFRRYFVSFPYPNALVKGISRR